MSEKALIVCADDFAISHETSEIILHLLAERRISATSCLVETGNWCRDAARLRDLNAAEPFAAGLHLNLTERFAHTLPGTTHPVAVWATRAVVARGGATARTIDAAFRHQWSLFVDAFGRPPDFLDGHQHVHLFPAMRDALFRLIDETNFKGWVRQCRTDARRRSRDRVVLDPLSRTFMRAAKRRGVAFNSGFGGLRAFRRSEDPRELWARDLEAMGGGGLLMVHPGGAGSPAGADAIDACRSDEAALLQAGSLDEILRAQGWVLSHTVPGATSLNRAT